MTGGGCTSAALRPGVSLYLIRHGQTDWNKAARYQGQTDIALNDTGRAQAHRNGLILRQLLPDIARADFVSSPLSRAVETTEIVLKSLGIEGVSYRLEPELKELHYGHWEGHLASDLTTTDADGVAAKARDPYGWRPTGGESYRDLNDRIAKWLKTVERDTVAITHGGVSRVARGAVLGIDTETVPVLDVPQDRVLLLRDGAMLWL